LASTRRKPGELDFPVSNKLLLLLLLLLSLRQGELVVIDVSQAVDLDHPKALDFLREDCTHVNDYFRWVLQTTEGGLPSVACCGCTPLLGVIC
jgi:hypothetical protein